MSLEAQYLEHNKVWIVRPKGQLGTIGSHPYQWVAIHIRAFTAEGAIARALPIAAKQRMGIYARLNDANLEAYKGWSP